MATSDNANPKVKRGAELRYRQEQARKNLTEMAADRDEIQDEQPTSKSHKNTAIAAVVGLCACAGLVIGYFAGSGYNGSQTQPTLQLASEAVPQAPVETAPSSVAHSGTSAPLASEKIASTKSSKNDNRLSTSTGPVLVLLLAKNYIESGSKSYIKLTLNLRNNSDKVINAFDGTLTIVDSSNNDLVNVALTDSQTLALEERRVWRGSIRFDPSAPSHTELKASKTAALKTRFELREVTYGDGSKEKFEPAQYAAPANTATSTSSAPRPITND